MENRIYFENNPWPEGHPLKNFSWTAEIREGDVWFHFHLETVDYNSERYIEDDEDVDYDDDWQSSLVWDNYSRCILSTNNWHKGGFRVCSKDEYCVEFLDGRTLNVDDNPKNIENWETLAFHIYLLGHDAAAKHKIKFVHTGSSTFDIEWSGKIAKAYVGNYDLDYDFKTKIYGVKMPSLNGAS